jgi:flagellar motility protein MotE (MotC chaperone)
MKFQREHVRTRRLELIAFAAALACAVGAAPGAADWDDVKVTRTPPVVLAQDDTAGQNTPAPAQNWQPVARQPSARPYMQSTVGPSQPRGADEDDDLPPLRPAPANAASRPAPIAPRSPGLAASGLVLKGHEASATKAQSKAGAQPNAADVSKAMPDEGKNQTAAKAEPAAAPTPAPVSGPARQYCINIADAAADARFAWKAKTLAEIEQELDKRIELLEQRTAEFQAWLARRDEFSNRAVKQLVDIYRRMAPDSAAAQLAAMDAETAAAVLSKLDARIASAILNEMQPSQAARLTTIIAGSAKIPAEHSDAKTAAGNSSAQTEEARSDTGKL